MPKNYSGNSFELKKFVSFFLSDQVTYVASLQIDHTHSVIYRSIETPSVDQCIPWIQSLKVTKIYMVTDILISVSAAERYHEDVLECLEQFSMPFEVNIYSYGQSSVNFSLYQV